MKKIILAIVVLSSIFFYSACDNDIDLTAEWKDIPIVYGLLSKNDTANYVRVEKAFLDNSTSAFELAQIPDSLYYDNITVQIRNTDPANPVTYTLSEVDGNQEGYVRDAGIFANAPNILYKLELPDGEFLKGGDEYELILNRGDNKELVTATATIVENIDIREPDTQPLTAAPVNWEQSGLNVAWRGSNGAFLFDVTVFLNIEEEDITDPANNRTVTLEWKIENDLPAVYVNNQVRMDTKLTKQDLMLFLNNRLVASPNIARKFASFDILVSGGGKELTDYISAGNANTGITSTQVIPTYTNLSEGVGIFSSRNSSLQQGYEVSNSTIDTLQNNGLTKDFNFQN